MSCTPTLSCFMLLLLLPSIVLTTSTNYNYHYFYNGDETSAVVFVDERLPVKCSSPGWERNPGDIEVLVGGNVFFQCRNKLPHNQTVWLLNGREDILYTNYNKSGKISIHNGGKSLRFGPVEKDDDGISINCEVYTNYGPLPSPLGIINVITVPSYNPSSKSVFIGKPFYFNFNYSGSKPETYRWYKNGVPYRGEQDRVILSSKGIAFTRVLQQDSGMYFSLAQNKAGSASGSAYLRVLYWWSNKTEYDQANNDDAEIPLDVAVTIAIDTTNRSLGYIKPKNKYLQVSAVDSTAYSMKILHKLNNKATMYAKQQGKSREEIEEILKRLTSIVGHPLRHLTGDEIQIILNASDCKSSNLNFNCMDYRVLRYRTINGTCNNLFFPLNGAAFSAFARLLPAVYEDGISKPHGHDQARSGNSFNGPWPSPRQISRKLINDLEEVSNDMSHMFMGWGQFLDHDLSLGPIFDEDDFECDCNFTANCLPIQVHPDDPVFGTNSSHMGKCLPFARSIPVCKIDGYNAIPRNQLNQLTSYLDASNVYGSEDKVADNLRLGIAGLLKEGGRTRSSKGNLPFQDEKPPMGDIPFFESGDERANEQVGLTVMHTIWMREHNRIAIELAKINPCWGDEKLYHESRKIVGAMMQVITYTEFLPILFGEYYLEYVPKYYGYNPFIDATIPNEFSTAAYRFGHSLVRPFLLRLDENYLPVKEGPLPLVKAFFNPIEYFNSNGTDPILRGLVTAQARDVDEFLNSILTSKLFTESPEKLGSDLASLNIQRGRDHGLAPYHKWQELCDNIFPGKNVTFKYPNTESKMKDLYGDQGFHEGMDLWVGGLAEKKLLSAQVGPTFACILGLTFTRIRDGDRFWYENPYTFSWTQLRELKKIRLSKVICNNADNIKEIQPNVFRIDQARVPCDTLNDISLWQWRDNTCKNRRTSRSYDELEE